MYVAGLWSLHEERHKKMAAAELIRSMYTKMSGITCRCYQSMMYKYIEGPVIDKNVQVFPKHAYHYKIEQEYLKMHW